MMDKKVEKFKSDYSNIEARAKMLKKKHLELKKEIKRLKREAKSVANKACYLYNRGIKTMYNKVEGSDNNWKPKFSGLNDMMDNIEYIMCIDHNIQRAIG